MRLRAILLAILLTGCGLVTTAAAEPVGFGMCPGYRGALLAARSALERGDRQRAVVDLQRAKAALTNCRREEARRTSLLASSATCCDSGLRALA